MIRLTLVRHGETYQNRHHVVQGQDVTQGRLTPDGVRQAELLGRALADEPFDIAYCSPLERAVLTLAQILLARPGERTLPLVFADALREIDLGALHGQSHTVWRQAIADADPMAFRPDGGESWLDVQARVTDYVRRTVFTAGHRNVLIVAHGGVNRGILASLLGFSMAQAWQGHGTGAPQDNTCVNLVELEPATGSVLRAHVNDTRHLAGAFPQAGYGQVWHADRRRWEVLGRAPWAGEAAEGPTAP